MKLTRHILLALLLLLPLAGGAQPLPTDSLPAADTLVMPLPADTLTAASDTVPPDTLQAPALPPDSIALLLRPDSLAADSLPAIALPDSIVPDSLPTDTLPADTLALDTAGIGTLSMEEMCRALQQMHLADIDLDKYFNGRDTIDTVPPALPTDSMAMPDSIPPAEPTDLMTLLRRGKVIRSMIPDSIVVDSALLARLHFTPRLLDSAEYRHNPLFCELVFKIDKKPLDWRSNHLADSLLYGGRRRTLQAPLDTFAMPDARGILTKLRQDARDYIARTDVLLYTTTLDQLPEVTWADNEQVRHRPIKEYAMDDFAHAPVVATNRIVVRRKQFSPWSGRLNSLLQFSQTAVSKNWHQGGYNFFSLLGGLNGYLNFDNRKKIKWENSFEWRTGFNTVTGDTIGPKGGRKAMPSDDVFKVNSKFGLQASGNFYYSASAEFQTNFFDNPKELNNYEMKTRFLTPIRLNVGLGMEFKYEWLSVNLAPLSFKFIYLTDTTTTDGFFIKPTEFGIEEGKNQLAEIGSKLVVEVKEFRPIPELKINSKLNFYTNYKKVEIDWEIVAELAINRFLSTRLMLNPRFDNTVILPDDEKAKLQMKQMLTVGISYRIL